MLLLVDDDALMRALLKPYLERAGFQTVAAEDGVRALELVRGEPPEAIILDVVMPEMSGLAVLRLLKTNEATKSIPVIIITAKYDRPTEEEAKRWGVAGYLTKPFSPALLVAELRRVTQKTRKTTEDKRE